MENSNLGITNPIIMEIERQRELEMENQVYEEMDSKEKKKRIDLKRKDNNNSKINRLIYYSLGVLEVLFAFRFVFRILGANTANAFVSFIYYSSNLFLTPFKGIFRMAVTEGIETKSVLEPTLIIGMVVYALLALGIVKLIEISRNHKDSDTL